MIFDAIAGARQKLSGMANPDQWLVDWVTGGGPTASGEQINERTALTCAAVYAAVTILSKTVATLPLQVFRKLPAGGKEPAPDHPVYRLLHDAPNLEVSSFNWRETGQGHLATWGNAYSEIQRTIGGQTVALWGVSPKPQHMKPFRDDDGVIRYRHRRDDAAGEGEILEARDVLHIPGFGFDGLVGYSPISLMKEPIGVAKGQERYAAELFANDAAHRGVLQAPGPLSDKAYNRLHKASNRMAEEGKRHRQLILEEGTTWAATNMKPEDVQMIQARRFSIEDIARIYAISLHLLQEFTEGAASYSSIVELGKEFIEFTMLPWLKRWCAEINRKLLDAEHFCEFNVSGFLQADPAARADFYIKMFTNGQMTINEIRAKENLNPIGPNGDVHFVPQNLQPLDKAIAAEDEPPPPLIPPPGQQPPPPEEEEGEEEDKTPAQFQSAIEGIRQEYDELGKRRRERNIQAARQVISDVMARMMHKEQQAASRAAKRPERFLTWMDEFYTTHQTQLAEALHNPIAALLAAIDGTGDVAAIAAKVAGEHCEVETAALLHAAECKPAKLADRVEESFSWEGTPMVDRIGQLIRQSAITLEEHTHDNCHVK
jgi:HK97 family phage portal protein